MIICASLRSFGEYFIAEMVLSGKTEGAEGVSEKVSWHDSIVHGW